MGTVWWLQKRGQGTLTPSAAVMGWRGDGNALFFELKELSACLQITALGLMEEN